MPATSVRHNRWSAPDQPATAITLHHDQIRIDRAKQDPLRNRAGASDLPAKSLPTVLTARRKRRRTTPLRQLRCGNSVAEPGIQRGRNNALRLTANSIARSKIAAGASEPINATPNGSHSKAQSAAASRGSKGGGAAAPIQSSEHLPVRANRRGGVSPL